MYNSAHLVHSLMQGAGVGRHLSFKQTTSLSESRVYPLSQVNVSVVNTGTTSDSFAFPQVVSKSEGGHPTS